MKIQKVSFLGLFVAFLIPVGIVVSLQIFSNSSHSSKNGFERRFTPTKTECLWKFDLKYNTYYLAGIADEKIYLGNYGLPDVLIVFNPKIGRMQQIQLKFPPKPKIAWGALKIHVEYPFVQAIEGVTPSIFTAKFPELLFSSQSSLLRNFDLPTPLSSSTIAFRTYDYRSRRRILGKQAWGNKRMKLMPNLEDNNKEGVFSTDGVLMLDSKSYKLIYLRYYSNEFQVLDSDLSLIYRGRTIDTLSIPRLTISNIPLEKRITLSSPPLLINRLGTVYNQILYIYSARMADNETSKDFRQNAVIDTYDISSNQYLGSHYLKLDKNQRIREFLAFRNHLIVLQGRFLAEYSFSFFKK
jgi:hypothetical protein